MLGRLSVAAWLALVTLPSPAAATYNVLYGYRPQQLDRFIRETVRPDASWLGVGWAILISV